MDFFCADTHFSHARIIEYSNRPFKTVDEMDSALIRNINDLVSPQDTLYHLGDWNFGGKDPGFFREQINCRNIVFIYGNHDVKIKRNKDLQRLFNGCYDYKEISIGKQKLCLMHYPLRVWNGQHWGSYMISGHSHGSCKESLPNSIDGGLLLDIGVDVFDYEPLCFDQINEIMKNKLYKMNNMNKLYRPDHHASREQE
jgi:calcineurin-like phosphoesterase family protein